MIGAISAVPIKGKAPLTVQMVFLSSSETPTFNRMLWHFGDGIYQVINPSDIGWNIPMFYTYHDVGTYHITMNGSVAGTGNSQQYSYSLTSLISATATDIPVTSSTTSTTGTTGTTGTTSTTTGTTGTTTNPNWSSTTSTTCTPCYPPVPTTPQFPPSFNLPTTKSVDPIIIDITTPPPVNPLTESILTTPEPTTTTSTTTTITTTITPIIENIGCVSNSCNKLGY